jgi:hypothetical protein
VRTSEDLQRFLRADDQCGHEYFLPSLTSDFIASKNRLWRESVVHSWRERYKTIVEAQETLAKFEEKEKSENLTPEERWERARLLRMTQGSEAALPLLREIVAGEPEHAGANYILGEALLEQGDETGIKHIEAAMEKDVHSIPAGCELIYNFLSNLKRTEEAERYGRCIADYFTEVELAQAERTTITINDDFKYHDVAPEVIRELRDVLKRYPDLATAHLVQKVVQHFPQEPGYVLGVTSKKPWYNAKANAQDAKLVGELAENVKLPGFTYIIALEAEFKPLRKIFERIQGAEIYRAG